MTNYDEEQIAVARQLVEDLINTGPPLDPAHPSNRLKHGVRYISLDELNFAITLNELYPDWLPHRRVLSDDLRDSQQAQSILFELDVYRFLVAIVQISPSRIHWTRYLSGEPDFTIDDAYMVECKLSRSVSGSISTPLRSVHDQDKRWDRPLIVFIGRDVIEPLAQPEHLLKSNGNWMLNHPTVNAMVAWDRITPPLGKMAIMRSRLNDTTLPSGNWNFGRRMTDTDGASQPAHH